MNMRLATGIAGIAGFTLLTAALSAQDHEERRRGTLRQQLRDPAADFWIYDDVERGYVEAKISGKPLLVSFRCVP